MRAPTLLITLSIVFGTPQTAAAASGLDNRLEAYWARQALRDLCMNHRLDREGSLRHAEAAGWAPLSAGETPKIEGVNLTALSARWKASPHGDKVVLVLGDGGEAGPTCAIAYHGPFDTASSVIGGHFMLPVARFEEVSPTYHLWAFVEEPGKRNRAVKNYFGKVDHALIASARAARTFSTLTVIGSPTTGGAAFVYSVPTAASQGLRAAPGG